MSFLLKVQNFEYENQSEQKSLASRTRTLVNETRPESWGTGVTYFLTLDSFAQVAIFWSNGLINIIVNQQFKSYIQGKKQFFLLTNVGFYSGKLG